MTGLILIILAFIVHGVAKAVADYIDFSSLDKIKNDRPKWFYIWTVGDPLNSNAGNPFKCDLWHFCAGHVYQWTIALGVIGGAYFGVSMWLIPIVWFGYWLEGEVFKYIFHNYFRMPR